MAALQSRYSRFNILCGWQGCSVLGKSLHKVLRSWGLGITAAHENMRVTCGKYLFVGFHFKATAAVLSSLSRVHLLNHASRNVVSTPELLILWNYPVTRIMIAIFPSDPNPSALCYTVIDPAYKSAALHCRNTVGRIIMVCVQQQKSNISISENKGFL